MALLLSARAASVACACTAGPRRAPTTTTTAAARHAALAPLARRRPVTLPRAEGEGGAAPGAELENPDSESSRKKAAADRLRAAEKFMVVGTGEATCGGCGFEYTPKAGDPEYPVPPGTLFRDLPEDWGCPVCGAGKSAFRSRAKEIAGFEENQRYGLGTNGLTGGQKSGLIYGALALFFLLFIGGYFLD